MAHRGLHDVWPENSVEAMVAAWEAGFEWCECDVHASADGVPVVIHDATLERTTFGTGAVRLRTWAKLCGVKLRDVGGTGGNCRLSSLQQVLAKMPAGKGLTVEIKPANDPQLVRWVVELADALPDRKFFFISFDPANVPELVARVGPERVGALVGSVGEVEGAVKGPAGWVKINWRLLDEQTACRLRAAHKRISVWTLNDLIAMGQMRRMGVERITSDVPKLLQAAL